MADFSLQFASDNSQNWQRRAANVSRIFFESIYLQVMAGFQALGKEYFFQTSWIEIEVDFHMPPYFKMIFCEDLFSYAYIFFRIFLDDFLSYTNLFPQDFGA